MTIYILTIILTTALVLFLRGGKLHSYLVLESESILRDAGFETYQEHPKNLNDGGTDFLDILARKGDFVLCIEIETTARNVLTNAAKAEQLGLPLIVVVPNNQIKKAVQNKLGKSKIRPAGQDIYILLLSQLRKEVMNYFSLFSPVNTDGKTKK